MSEALEGNPGSKRYRGDYSDFPINMPLGILRLSEAIFEDIYDDPSLDPEEVVLSLKRIGLLNHSDAMSVMSYLESLLNGSFHHLSMYSDRELRKFAQDFQLAGLSIEEAVEKVRNLDGYSELEIKLFEIHYRKLVTPKEVVHPPFKLEPKDSKNKVRRKNLQIGSLHNGGHEKLRPLIPPLSELSQKAKDESTVTPTLNIVPKD